MHLVRNKCILSVMHLHSNIIPFLFAWRYSKGPRVCGRSCLFDDVLTGTKNSAFLFLIRLIECCFSMNCAIKLSCLWLSCLSELFWVLFMKCNWLFVKVVTRCKSFIWLISVRLILPYSMMLLVLVRTWFKFEFRD